MNEWGEQARIQATVGLPDLSRFSEIARTRLAGHSNTRLDVAVKDFGKQVAVNISSEIAGFETAYPEVYALLGNTIAISGNARLDEEGI